jgi:ATP-dependent DNA helicase RecG
MSKLIPVNFYKETESVELKKSTSELKEAIISIAAILNKHGKGEIYFGIKDDGAVLGQTIGKDTIKDITEAISAHIEPKIFPHVMVESIQGKICIKVVFYGTHGPYFAYGRAYARVGESDKRLSVQEMENQFIRKSKFVWELDISKKKLSDVSVKSVKEYMRKANDAKRINFRFTNIKSTLSKLGLLDRGRLTRAAEILFCNENSMEVQAAVFASKDKITFIDIQKFSGNLFSLRDQSEEYIKKHIMWRADMSESRRKEIPEVPIRAFSEAIGNSLCHRDYSNPKGNEIAIFKDRIEIYNPGKFPEDLNPEDFFKGDGHSVLRNPLIAETMYRSEDIEKWASGLKRIHEECDTSQVKVEFKRVKTGFVVCFFRPKWEQGEGLKKGEQTREKSKEKGKEKSREKILRVIAGNPNITTQEIADAVGLSIAGVEKVLRMLKKQGQLKRIGPDKGGHWEAARQY